jgi:hypothetical protein
MFNDINQLMINDYLTPKINVPWYHLHKWQKKKLQFGANFHGVKKTCKKCGQIKYT